MTTAAVTPEWQRAIYLLTGTVVAAIVVAALYWAQAIFLPFALAVFLTFILSPIVTFFQKRGLPRIPAVIVVVMLTGVSLGVLGWLVFSQLSGLAEELPKHTNNIKEKIRSFRSWSDTGVAAKFQEMLDEISVEFKKDPIADASGNPLNAGRDVPTPVVVRAQTNPWLSGVSRYMNSFTEVAGSGALALLLVVFMLLSREDLRNRLLRLIGHGRVTVTTKAVDDAGQRISRFLLMQAIINGTYGLAVGVALFLIGVQYAFLWGFFSAVLRYIPYIGPWFAASLPITISFAISDGWAQPILVISMFVIIELISNNVMEPWLYGQSLGVSQVALIVSAAFWAFIWGPIGMVLSFPLTVVLVVLGRYVPQLEFLAILLSDEPALAPDVRFYQRLLARDQDEATDLAVEHSKASDPEKVFDELFIPALVAMKRDRDRDDLTAEDEKDVLETACEIIQFVGEYQEEHWGAAETVTNAEGEREEVKVRLLACPARDQADRLGLEMLREMLGVDRWVIELASVSTLCAEFLDMIEEKKPAAICIGSLPPGGLAHTRYYCKRIRARFPNLKIIVGRWGLTENADEERQRLQEAGADMISASLVDTRNQLTSWLPVLAPQQSHTDSDPPENGKAGSRKTTAAA